MIQKFKKQTINAVKVASEIASTLVLELVLPILT